ncbi:neutral cholesterol ester hydrolase 1-like [Littorina saxatilis]|uniref:Alpha/beta hydrolase fold-3 domain-containing protein n=1 Tax=Littorina saxatilis TaxID=31220 RepID=A0AAN9C1P3_9CAEN
MGAPSGWVGYIVLGGLLVGFSWFLYCPGVPEWAGERFLLQIHSSGIRFANLMSLPAPYLTGFMINERDVFRWITEMFYFNYIPDNDVWVRVSDATFDGVPVKIFHPRAAQNDSPAIVFIHGGGWSVLSADSYSATTYYIAWKLNVVVVSIDYRLAPEHPYPAPFEDCLKATVHLLRKAVKYDIDPSRIAIAGDSAGGNLATAVALKLSKDETYSDLPHLKFQVLMYPVTQMLDFNTYSYTEFAHTGSLWRELMFSMVVNYLGFPELLDHSDQFEVTNHTSPRLKNSVFGSYVKHENLPEEFRVKGFKTVGENMGNENLAAKIEPMLTDPYFAPLMAPDLSKVPPVYMILAQNDPLRDDGLFYAKRLREAGVKTEIDFHKTMAHGFCLLTPASLLTFQGGKDAYDTLGGYVQKNL